ncbi:Hsp20/alpha crystallin family protein [Bacillus dakarensis]|uniref:Hsp20/alpha crystallin family protein n=1 Tax=Robertmurraya dakarensis TaxID=1926278 RepID=UPI000980D11B|nr:Hsp20/alpha crystallin family protein [Bacillus dakarensis]
MSSNLPNDPRKRKLEEPFGDLMRSMNEFFHAKPVKGLLQSIDEFFQLPFTSFPVGVKESEAEHIITAELPGVKKEQIDLQVVDDSITISVKHHEMLTEEDENRQLIRSQQSMRKMSRTVYLGQPINDKKVKASYRDGLLEVRIPKRRGKKINIETNG